MYLTGGTSASVNLRNNIFANYCAGYAINVATTATISTSNYNDLYTTGTNVGYWTSARSNLAALQTASGKDANSVSVAPGFYTTTDLHVNTSGISNLGTPVSGITDDFDGESRSSSTPDIGADEFTLAANDAGITGLVSPLSFCAGSNTVKAAVKNYGTSILTTVIVNWQVNGTSQTPDTFSVSLSQYQEATVTLGTYNFSAGTSYNIKMWSSKPNSSNDGNNKNDTFLIQNRQSGLNGTYTIGATSANYKTFNTAISDLKTKGICGAVVFRVYAGNYNEYFSIPEITGISSNNTITFESYNHDSTSVDLNYESTKATYNYVVELNGADYITFRQITIRATGTSYGIAVSITGGSDYNTFSNNIIQTKAGSGSWNFGGIISTESIDNYNSIINNIISGGNHGIRFTGSNTTSENKNIIKNNWIKDFYSFGVSTLYQRAITIENNRIQNDTSATGPYGIGITYTNDSIKVIKNRIELSGHAGNTGIYGYYCVGATTAPSMIANNFISQKGVVTGSNYGIYLYFCSYQNFFNNTVRLDDKGTVFYAYNGSYIRLLNNIMATFGGGYAMYVTPGSNLASSDYNDFYTTGPVLCFWGSDLSDLAAWKSATAKDTHSLSVDPFFYSSSDLHVYYRMLDSAGIPISSVKTDIDNQSRDPNKPDIGADEFDKFYRDAGIIQYIGPNVPCPASATNVTVKLKNYGCSRIDTIIIKWTVNGIRQTPKTYSGNLAPLMDTIIDIGTFTFNAGNSYDLKVWTDSINGGTDQLHLNDTISVKGIRAGKSGTYTIGPSGRDYPSFNAAVNDLISNGVCGPVSFVADTGSYNEQISIPSISGASSTNTITFKSVSNDSSLVNLNFTSTNATNNYVVELKGADYITFKKIKIKANSSTYARAVHVLEGSDYNNFTCNQILSSLSGSNNVNTSGIYSENSLDDYNTFTNNYIQGGYYGIYLSGLDDKTRENFNTIKNNIIRDCYSAGISFYYQNSPEVSGNLIEAKYTNYGIYGYCSYDSTIITGNRVSISGWGGARYCLSVNTTVGTPAKSALIANNSLSQKESTSGSNVGLEVNGTTYLNIFYNSVNIRSSSTGMISGLFINSASYINVINNIFAVKEKGYAVIVGNPGTSFNSDYNNFITDGATFGDWTTAQLATLDDWKVRSKVDIHSISIDPYFYSDIDLHPYSIKLDKSAIPLSEVKTDIDNKVRNTTNPDIGAYEIDPFNFDASIESVVEPLPPCAGVMNNVVVKLKNYGNTTINSTRIKWSVNDTFQTPYNFTGSVPNLKDTTILIGSFKFYKGKSYRLKFWADTINYVADQNHRNDTF